MSTPPDDREAPSSRTILRQVQWLGGSQFASQAAWYAVYLVLAALLAPEDFGTVAAGMAVVGAAQMLMEAGTGGSIVAARRVTRRHLMRIVAQNLGVGLLLTILIAALAGPLVDLVAEDGDPSVVRGLSLAVVLSAIGVVPMALLQKALRFERVAIGYGLATLITAVGAIIAAALGAGVWALVARQLLLAGGTGALYWLLARDLLGRLDTLGTGTGADDESERPRHQWAFLTMQVSLFVATTFDALLVGAVTDARQLGFYSLAFALAFAPLTRLAWVLGSVLFPAAAATADLTVVGRRTVSVVRASSLLMLPFVAPAAVLAAPLLPGVLGAEWDEAVAPFQILIAVGIGHALLNPIGEALAGSGSAPLRARIEVVWALLTLVGVYVGARAGGISGAAVAHVPALVFLVVAYGAIAMRHIGSTGGELWTRTRDILGAVVIQAGVTFVVAELAGPDLLGAAVAAVAGLLVAGAALRVAPTQPLSDMAQFARLVRGREASAA